MMSNQIGLWIAPDASIEGLNIGGPRVHNDDEVLLLVRRDKDGKLHAWVAQDSAVVPGFVQPERPHYILSPA